MLFWSGGLVQAIVVGVCPLPTSFDTSSVAGKIHEIGTLFKTQLLLWGLFGVVDPTNPMRERALCFFKSAKVHAPPDKEGTLLRAADNGDEGRDKVNGKGIIGVGPLFVVDWLVETLLPLDVLMVTETWMSIVLSLRAEVVR